MADFTSCGECIACDKCEHIGARGGVYFEAGFALGLGKTVFLTCREDRTKAVHFDIDHLTAMGDAGGPAEAAQKQYQSRPGTRSNGSV